MFAPFDARPSWKFSFVFPAGALQKARVEFEEKRKRKKEKIQWKIANIRSCKSFYVLGVQAYGRIATIWHGFNVHFNDFRDLRDCFFRWSSQGKMLKLKLKIKNDYNVLLPRLSFLLKFTLTLYFHAWRYMTKSWGFGSL